MIVSSGEQIEKIPFVMPDSPLEHDLIEAVLNASKHSLMEEEKAALAEATVDRRLPAANPSDTLSDLLEQIEKRRNELDQRLQQLADEIRRELEAETQEIEKQLQEDFNNVELRQKWNAIQESKQLNFSKLADEIRHNFQNRKALLESKVVERIELEPTK